MGSVFFPGRVSISDVRSLRTGASELHLAGRLERSMRSTLGAVNAPTPPRVGTRISLERR